jgi:hypothetical protein
MKKQLRRTARREFLAESVKRLAAMPLAVEAARAVPAEGEPLPDDGPEPLPGDSGYRDPDTYGSLTD